MGKRERSGRKHWEGRIGLGGVVALALGLLIAIPSAVDASSAPRLKAPYSGSNYGWEDSYFAGCNGNVTWARSPFFNLSNGHAYTNAQVSQPACASTFSYTEAYAGAELITTSLSLPAGHHSVAAHWTASYSIDLVASPGPSPQTASATAELYAAGYIVDQTNDTYIYATYTTYLDHEIFSGSQVASFHGAKLTAYFNYTFVAGHSYEIVVYIQSFVEANISAGASTASAEVNTGTSGKSSTLVSIST
jgi:hypothetical protein